MIYKNRPRPEHYELYTKRTTKLIRFPDHVIRIIDLNDFEWAVLNWMIDGEGLDLEADILDGVLEIAQCYSDPENYVNCYFSSCLDSYLHLRVQEWGPQTVDEVVRRFAA